MQPRLPVAVPPRVDWGLCENFHKFTLAALPAASHNPGPVQYPAAIALTISLALALGACGQRFSNANIDVINHELEKDEKLASNGRTDVGVSPKQVESILGPPKSIETRKFPLETQKKEVDVVRYIYEQDGQTIELHFFDNKLIQRLPHLGEKSPDSEPVP